jgi:hypothetical protein
MLLATSRRWPFAGQYMVNADANCMATVLAEAFDGGSTNVDMDMLTFSVSPEGPYGLGTTDVTLTVSDGTVMSQCTTSVTVLDVTPPVVTCAEFSQTFSGEDQCADAIVQNNPTGMFSPIGDLTMFSAAAGGSRVITADLSGCVADNCLSEGLQAAFVDSYEENRVAGCSVDIINVVVIRDAADNEAEDSIFFRHTIIYDGPAPVITCSADSLIDCGEEPTVMASDATATSGCGTAALTVSDAVIVGEPNTAGTTYTFTFTATDGCGQTSMCDQVFTVQDTIAPTVMANDTTLYLDDNGMAELSVEDYEYAASDDCAGGVTITDIFRVGPDMFFGGAAGANNAKAQDQVLSFTCDDVGNINLEVEIEAIDGNGNIGLDTIIVTVLDTIKPMVTCIDTDVFLDANGEGDYFELNLFTATDNCEVDFAPFDQGFIVDCSDIGTPINVDLTVFDVNGNDTTCTAVVTVIDTIKPVVMANDTTLYLDAAGMASLSVSDYEYAATDNCGDPTITNINNLAAAAGAMFGGQGAGNQNRSFDQVLNFTCDDVGNINLQVEIEATGVDGSIGLDTILVTVLDTIKPMVTCIDTDVFLDANGEGDYFELNLFTATDNCEVDFAPFDQGFIVDCSDIGTPINVDLTVFDVNGNDTTCTAVVTVIDTIKPVVMANDTTLYLDAAGMASLSVSDYEYAATDNCGDPTITNINNLAAAAGAMFGGQGAGNQNRSFDQVLSFTCDDVGNINLQVEIEATGVDGSIGLDTILVTVLDTIKPMVTCIDTDVFLDANGEGDYFELNLFTATDNCEVDFAPFDQGFIVDCSDIGTPINVDLTVFDVNGNDTTCTAVVTVIDTISPVITVTHKQWY